MLTLDALAKRATIAAFVGLLLSLVSSGTAAALAGLAVLYLLLILRNEPKVPPWQR